MTEHCVGCDTEQEGVKDFDVHFAEQTKSERVRYCPQCAALVQAGFNPEIVRMNAPDPWEGEPEYAPGHGPWTQSA